MSKPEFVHLHVHSGYSLLDGACSLDGLLQTVQKQKMPALAVTDHGNMFGAVDFYARAKDHGVKPILGCEVYVAPRSRFERLPEETRHYEGANHLTLLVGSEEGYRNLIELSSLSFLEGFYHKPRVDRELLEKHARGLVCLSGCLNSEIGRALQEGKPEEAHQAATWYRDLYGADNFFVEIQDHGLPEQRCVNEGLIAIADRLGAKVVATNDVHYLNASDALSHEVLLCIQTGKTLKDPHHWKFQSDQFYMKHPREMEGVFPQDAKFLRNTLEVADRCNLQLRLDRIQLPHFEVPEGLTPDEHLRNLALKGLHERYEKVTSELTDRLEHELGVIKKMGFSDYYLIVWDIIRYGREKGIMVGPGRGSAAGSLVAYCLRITNIDPIRFDLLFERFLSPERISMPDMDIDFQDDRRDEVVDYVVQKYGREHVAHIITFGSLGVRQVVRDVGRALGLPYGDVDRFAKLFPQAPNIETVDDAMRENPALATETKERREYGELCDISRNLTGLFRHASVHAAGIVISATPLTEQVPLYKGNTGDVSTQYPMKPIEKIGLLKMDLLGLTTLNVISTACRLVRENYGVVIDIEAIPQDDPKTYRLLEEGRTFAVFQLESQGMRDVLQRLKPTRLEDIVAVVALYRPGPMKFIDDFIARKSGRVRVAYPHRLLEPILKETAGIMVYQEQIMRIGRDMAKFDAKQIEKLRKAMGKKDREAMMSLKDPFVEGAGKNGVPREQSAKIFDMIADFAGYAFNKSHAAAYATVAYQTAYLKANYPAEYMAALLSAEIGKKDKILRHFEECRRMGIPILAPDVNSSGPDFTVVKAAAGEAGKPASIRFGLTAIKNIGSAAIESVLAGRDQGGPFQSLRDFLDRVNLTKVNKKAIESLIKAGAFDSLGEGRGSMWGRLESLLGDGPRRARGANGAQVGLFGAAEESQMVITSSASPGPGTSGPAQVEWTEEETLAFEKEVLGFYLSKHPLERHIESLKALRATPIDQLAEIADRREVWVAGLTSDIQQKQTKSNDPYAILTLEDMTGTVEVIVWPKLYQQASMVLHQKTDPIVVIGLTEVSERNGGRGRGQAEGGGAARAETEESASGRGDRVRLVAKRIEYAETLLRELRGRGQAQRGEFTIRVDLDTMTSDSMRRLEGLIRSNPGPCRIRVLLASSGVEKTLLLPGHYGLSPDVDLVKMIQAFSLDQSVRLLPRSSAASAS